MEQFDRSTCLTGILMHRPSDVRVPSSLFRTVQRGMAQARSASGRSSAQLLEVGAELPRVQASTSSLHLMPPWEAAPGGLPAAGRQGAPSPTGQSLGRTRLERIDDARFRLVCLWSCPVRLSRTGDQNQRWIGMLIPTGFAILPLDALGHEGRPNVLQPRHGPAR